MINSRTKGHAFERQIAVDFQELGWNDAMTKRAARGGDWSTTDDGIDIVNVEPFAIQCKRFKGYAPISCIEEITYGKICPPRKDHSFARQVSETSCIGCDNGMSVHPDAIPILITKADNKPAMAVLPWSELQRLIRATFKSDAS